MPEPIQRGHRYIPGLDGIRALAVLAVIGYHVNLPPARGGLLGVGVFFTLSGYLITDLLLSHWERNGDLGLRIFWLRRARRLLPALVLMLAVVSVWVGLFHAGQLGDVRKQVIASALYVSNWWTIAEHGSYFARFAPPLPLDHLWSLAIEEQFYLVWPWLLLIGVWITRNNLRLATFTLLAAAASAVAMGLLYAPGYDPTRVYEGTDTRAFGLLVGAALAIVWPSGHLSSAVRPAFRNLLDAGGIVGLAGIAALVWTTDSYSPFLYPAGFVLLSLATTALVGAVAHPASRVGALLGWGPLRWIGVRSYGIYLWHWPIIVLTKPTAGEVVWWRTALQVAATFVVAGLSWRYVEEPIRRGALGRIWQRVHAEGGGPVLPRRVWIASGALLAATVLPISGLSGILPVASTGTGQSARAAKLPGEPEDRSLNGRPVANTERADRTSCRSVVYIGGSTSESEVSPEFIPDPARRLPGRLQDVGVKSINVQVSGARSIVETYQDEPNAASVARRIAGDGFRGCWVLDLGTNDSANIAAGSPVGEEARISRMMSIIGRQRVLWLDAVSLRQSGPYANAMMRRWNKTLVSACAEYPSLRVFDWAALVKRGWFTSDGVHYGSLGSEKRAHLTSRALVTAFPANGGRSNHCVVRLLGRYRKAYSIRQVSPAESSLSNSPSPLLFTAWSICARIESS
jgi:peptidoglycan/LPS O-acetylase OafA/YrhL